MRRTLKAVITAVALLGATIGTATVTTAPAQALGAGAACMFNAPTGAQLVPWLGVNAGHVGWAFLEGGTKTWEYGATESATNNWRASGNEQQMFDAFYGLSGHGIHTGYYTKFRCKQTANSSVGAASNEVNRLYGQTYSGPDNNCLTRTVSIFKAYDSSFGGMDIGSWVAPNFYFDNLNAVGFGPAQTLPR